jgi:cytidylate kinase
MAKPTISSYVKDRGDQSRKKSTPGPYLTISRQFGCDGYAIGKAVVDMVNEDLGDEDKQWQIYQDEIIDKLVEDTGVKREIIEKERLAKPKFFKDLFRGLKGKGTIDSLEIRRQISIIVRELCFEGNAVVIGHGGAAATMGLKNGLCVRIEGSKEWRLAKICRDQKISKVAALNLIEERDKQRRDLQKYYMDKNPRQPAFNLMIDNSMFSEQQIAEMIVEAMKKNKLVVEG